MTEQLKQLQCRTLIFVGENSQFHTEAVHMTSKLDRRYCALVEVSNHLQVYQYLKALSCLSTISLAIGMHCRSKHADHS